MKNLKIFPKICIQTFSVIAIIVLFIHLFVYLIFPRTYLDVRKEEIYTKANEITENLNGKSEDYIEQALDFYSNTNEIKAFIKKNASSNEVEIKNDLNVDLKSSNNSLIIEERKLKLDTGKSIRLQFVSTADMQLQAKNLSLQFLPYSLILSLCFSAIVSFVYAKSIKNYVVEIKRVTDQMMALDKKARLEIDSNDEIGQLKAQINDLYETLLDSISNLEVKNKEILRLEKIKYDFFKGASHELKTPLASLKIILENMKYNVGKYKNRDVYIDDCIDLVDHLTKSIQQILSVYSIENLKDDEEIVCIKNELSRVLQKYDVLIHQKELRIQNDVKDETMYIGKTALNIILSNLISNAINYTYVKGIIQIGIEQDYFYIQNKQDPTQPKGNGLGLYIVRNLLDNYKMKYEAMKHQGSKGEKHTADLVGEAAGESGRTVQRYIRLSFLISRLLDYVDNKRLSMKAGEKLSFLTVEEQEWVLEAIDNAVLTVTDKQAELFKNHSREKTLNQGIIYSVLLQKKEAETKVTLSAKKVRSYFPPAYTKEQVEEVIYTLLEQWRKKKGKEEQEDAGDTV